MKKVLIFGTGSTGRRIYGEIKKSVEVVGFLDNDLSKGGYVEGIPILGNGENIEDASYDEIIICSLAGMRTIQEGLLEKGISRGKINCEYVSTQVNARINFLRDFAKLHEDLPNNIAVGEGGVFQGEFAKEINRSFPKNRCFLFDTFEGFDERDTQKEHEKGFSIFEKNHLSNTSVDLVLTKLPFPESVEIRKGYFPETTTGLENQNFFFVNLDFDLYNPTLDGLRFFYQRLYKEGVILIHDYYNPGCAGIKAAVDDFEKELGKRLCRIPIGDRCSIAIIKR